MLFISGIGYAIATTGEPVPDGQENAPTREAGGGYAWERSGPDADGANGRTPTPDRFWKIEKAGIGEGMHRPMDRQGPGKGPGKPNRIDSPSKPPY